MPEDSVKVAVRVRPFNQRELDRSAKLVVKMEGQMTTLINPDATHDDPKRFSFDYSYWSHDSFTIDADGINQPEPGSKYASQRRVFDDLGQGVLDNAFEGYNCSLFAYGQTGSGKSYSMVGYGKNRGIVPITCDELFQTIESNADANKRFTVSFSMLEIYNEQVRDLLSKDNPKGGLQVRQNPKLGLFYVQGLKQVPVGSYADIEKRMNQGTAVRTVASTNMNATSSRAHTVVTIVFDQILKTPNGESKKSSVMNLVDLAGSERADSTGATGDRLKEGANINRSLSALGNVISALAELSSGKKKNVMVPYRDSVLTKLLQNALGGNSKTVMIAALSPADINYDETLSTLRYADRAKQIKNKAVVNENPLDRMIRMLKEENERLKKQLEGGALPEGTMSGMSPEEIEKMRQEMMEEIRAQMMANQELIVKEEEETSAEQWEKQLQLARSDTVIQDQQDSRKKRDPHLMNLNEDPMLTGVVFHFLLAGETSIGRKDADTLPTVCLSGLSIMKNHAVIKRKDGEVEISPAVSGAKTKVNGTPLTGKRVLEDKDRILFGSNHLYMFVNPQKRSKNTELPEEITWEFAQKEIAQAKGFTSGVSKGMTKDQQIAQEQVLELLPMVSEVNAISEELNKYRNFEVVILSAAAQEVSYKESKVMVKMKNLLNGNSWLWERGKFMNRRYLMQDMYQRFLETGDDKPEPDVPKEEDPFWEPAEDVLIGTATAYLQSLLYALDFNDSLTVVDYKGQEEGRLSVEVIPCNQTGKPLDEDFFIEEPNELLDKPYYFKVRIRDAEIYKTRFNKGIHIKYRVHQDDKYKETEIVQGEPNQELHLQFNHKALFSFAKLTQDHLSFFENGNITFLVYGVQEDCLPDPKLLKQSTKELRQMETYQQPRLERQKTMFQMDMSESGHLKSEVLLLQKKFYRLEQKEKRLQAMCKEWKEKPRSEQNFEAFHRAVSALAYSSGTKLKTRVQILNKVLMGLNIVRKEPFEVKIQELQSVEEDTLSVYVFGEEEDRMSQSAAHNQGLLTYKDLVHHYGTEEMGKFLAAQRRANMGASLLPANGTASPAPGKAQIKQGDRKREGSKACVIQ